MSKKIFFFGLFIISILYLSIRLWDISIKLDFRADQAIHLSEAKNMVESRTIRLIGPMVTSQSFDGRNFFIGANYYYVLALAGILTNWDPLLVTVFFIFIELIFYVVFTFFLKQKFGTFISLISFFTIAVSPYLVAHSRFFWNPHLLIPLSIIAIISLEKYIDTRKYIFLAISAFVWGFAFSAHYSAIFWLPIFIFYLTKSRQHFNIKSLLIIGISFVVGDLPFFIFELRHNFYNLKTFFLVYFHPSASTGFTSHYLIFPLIVFLIYFLHSLFKKYKTIFVGLLFLVTIIQFYIYPRYPSLGTVPGWDYPTQVKIAESISQKCPPNFNVAATMQGDTRFYGLRYLLAKNNCIPEDVENYPTSMTLFLVAPHNRSPSDETVWEVASLKPFTITSTTQINDQLDLHRLDRQ